MNDDVEDYRAIVKKLIELKSSKPVSNGRHAHAAVLFEQFFKHESDSVKIFCENLSAQVFDVDYVIEAAKDAIKRNKSIEVVMQEPTSDSKKFIDLLITNNMTPVIASAKYRNTPWNFTVMDDCAYRFEPNKREPVATANMYDPETAKYMADLFDTIKSDK